MEEDIPVSSYKFLEHTADAKFRAFGDSLEEAFGNAALALVSLMWKWQRTKKKTSKRIEVAGRDLHQLLSVYLEEVLFLFESEGFLLAAVERLEIEEGDEGYSLRAWLQGDLDDGEYEVYGDVKAITYNEMRVEMNDSCFVQVVVDI
ncbi:protein archease [Candidatus Fermentibacteria bacterium]|nr:protein archease [Candidatus Fermentibacteria bacterium]